jgi:transcriptional regulator with XRE-family HTH domain
MSYLSDELERQMKSEKLTGSQLAERTGISSSQIYNWLKNVQISINEKQLKSLQTALTQDSHNHARLVLAHLLDEKFGHGSEHVDVSLKGDFEKNAKQKTSARGEKALQYLGVLRMKSRDCNDLLIDLARVLGADI